MTQHCKAQRGWAWVGSPIADGWHDAAQAARELHLKHLNTPGNRAQLSEHLQRRWPTGCCTGTAIGQSNHVDQELSTQTSGLRLYVFSQILAVGTRTVTPARGNYSMTWVRVGSPAEPLLGDAAQPGKPEAQQHGRIAAAQLAKNIRVQDRVLRDKAWQKAVDILVAAKRFVEPLSMDGTASRWRADVPEPDHEVLISLVKANLEQLCKGTGLEALSFGVNHVQAMAAYMYSGQICC